MSDSKIQQPPRDEIAKTVTRGALTVAGFAILLVGVATNPGLKFQAVMIALALALICSSPKPYIRKVNHLSYRSWLLDQSKTLLMALEFTTVVAGAIMIYEEPDIWFGLGMIVAGIVLFLVRFLPSGARPQPTDI